MGLFLQTAILPGCSEETAHNALITLAQRDGALDLDASRCKLFLHPSGVQILFHEDCAGYDPLARGLSELTGTPVLLLYIYDGDFWGYFFYENGAQLDHFPPIPDYFGQQAQDFEPSGNSALIAQHFSVSEEIVARYLITWTDADMEEARKACDDDAFCTGDCWQMADFMAKLGWPYRW